MPVINKVLQSAVQHSNLSASGYSPNLGFAKRCHACGSLTRVHRFNHSTHVLPMSCFCGVQEQEKDRVCRISTVCVVALMPKHGYPPLRSAEIIWDTFLWFQSSYNASGKTLMVQAYLSTLATLGGSATYQHVFSTSSCNVGAALFFWCHEVCCSGSKR